jgi:hypothetical protein
MKNRNISLSKKEKNGILAKKEAIENKIHLLKWRKAEKRWKYL